MEEIEQSGWKIHEEAEEKEVLNEKEGIIALKIGVDEDADILNL